jgi:uroporphyrinogen-III synthase
MLMAIPSFNGLRVMAFESRRSAELASLITTYGGEPIVAPALREVPLESNAPAREFAAALLRGEFDVVIFLTGVGARALIAAAEDVYSRAQVVEALARTRVVARGPKPLGVLRELHVPVWMAVAEPNTWRELVRALDARAEEQPMAGARIAIQEYGVSNRELLDELRARKAQVVAVPVYRWALPDDLEPLKKSLTMIANGNADVVIFTTGVQVVHVWRVAQEMGLAEDVRRALTRAVIASIGPTTSHEIRRSGLEVDYEPSHSRIGILVREVAERAFDLLQAKRARVE